MLKITMYSSADKVAGQGVGSAYLELMHLLKTNFKDEFDIAVISATITRLTCHFGFPLFQRNAGVKSATCTFCQRL